VVRFGDVEHLHQANPAGAGRRRRVDVVTAVGAVDRRTGDGPVAVEVRPGDEPAAGLHLGDDLVGDRALVEGVRPVLGNQLERGGEVLLHQPVARLPVAAALGLAEDALQFRKLARRGDEGTDRRGVERVEGKTFLRQADGGEDDFFPGQLAEALLGQCQAADGAGDADDLVAEFAVLLAVHGFVRGGGGGLAVVDDDGVFLAAGVDDHEAAAADVAGRGVGDGQREGCGDRGIDGVAAFFQDLDAYLGSGRRDRDDEAVTGFDRFFGSGGALLARAADAEHSEQKAKTAEGQQAGQRGVHEDSLFWRGHGHGGPDGSIVAQRRPLAKSVSAYFTGSPCSPAGGGTPTPR